MNKRIPKLRGKRRKFRNAEQLIPKGHYCYGTRPDGRFVYCPFHAKDKTQERQNNGVCRFLKIDDYSDGHWGLLWDFCKSCDVNDEWE